MKTTLPTLASYYIGLMSGTSLDGIDAALVAIEDGQRPRLVATHAEPMPEALREQLLCLCQANQASFAELAAAEAAFCDVQAAAVRQLLEGQALTAADICAIGSHGQTIEHAPTGHHGGPAYTLQLDNPSLLAELTGCCVVADFRRRDLAAGGQAAPLAPAFHHALFGQHPHEEQLILNLGGFANITWLPSDPTQNVTGFDTGPANVLLDAWYTQHHGGRFDDNGAWAASGTINHALLEAMLAEPFFHQPPPRSTGRELFHLAWLARHLTGHESPVDVQATLVELTALSIAKAVELLPMAQDKQRLIIGGGGAHNAYLMARIAQALPETTLTSPAADGWPEDWIEAGAFAWLAHQRLHETPANLPSVTGARGRRILGGIYAR